MKGENSTHFSLDVNGYFQKPVDTILLSNYLSVVSKPMDFQTMNEKANAGEYLKESYEALRLDSL